MRLAVVTLAFASALACRHWAEPADRPAPAAERDAPSAAARLPPSAPAWMRTRTTQWADRYVRSRRVLPGPIAADRMLYDHWLPAWPDPPRDAPLP